MRGISLIMSAGCRHGGFGGESIEFRAEGSQWFCPASESAFC